MTTQSTTTTSTAPPSELHAYHDTRFDAYAVTSRSGPHVTTQAGVLHAGRFWTTTSASSLKTRSVEAHGVAGAVVPDGARNLVLSGRTTAVRVQRPFALTGDPTAPLRAPGAILRLGITQAEQLLGYVESSRRIPPEWLPHRRVLLVTRLDRTMTLAGFDVVETAGGWEDRGDPDLAELAVDGDAAASDLPRHQLPRTHRPVVRLDVRVHLGVSTPSGPVALPARWLGDDRFVTSAPALAVADGHLPGRAVAVFAHSSSRRPEDKRGVMFRGHGSITDLDGSVATVALRAERVTTWDGFAADTMDVER